MNRVLKGAISAVLLSTIVSCGGQSKECKDYVDCAEKVSPGTRATNETSFGPNGSCWSTGVQIAADQCTAQCKAGNDAYKGNGDATRVGCTFQ